MKEKIVEEVSNKVKAAENLSSQNCSDVKLESLLLDIKLVRRSKSLASHAIHPKLIEVENPKQKSNKQTKNENLGDQLLVLSECCAASCFCIQLTQKSF